MITRKYNHIRALTAQRDALRADLNAVSAELTELLCYLRCDKFAWPEHDYVFVSTDLAPKLSAIRTRADQWRAHGGKESGNA